MQQFVGSDRRGELSETCRVAARAALKSDVRPNGDGGDEDPLCGERAEERSAPREAPGGGDEGDGEERRRQTKQYDVREDVSHLLRWSR